MANYREKYEALEVAWMGLKDQYSEVARALGFEGDAWFNDPLATHEEIVARAHELATRGSVAQQQQGEREEA